MHISPLLFYKQVTLSPLVCKVAEIWGWENNLALGKGITNDTVYNNLLQPPVPSPGPALGVVLLLYKSQHL